MPNFIFSYINWIDAGIGRDPASLSASHETTTLPVANLATDDILKIWRALGTTAASAQADLGRPRDIRVLGLFGLARLAASDKIRWRLGSTAGAGDVYDSGVIDCGRFAGYAQSVHCLPETLSARHVRVDLDAPSQAAANYIDAGRLWAGNGWQGIRNYSYGAQDDIDDGKSQQVDADRAPASSVFIDARTPGRVKSFGFEAMSPAEKYTVLEIKRIAGRKRQVVFVPDPADPEIQREALLGIVETADPIRQMNFPTRATAFTLRGALLEE
jgi:hypothetical protein